jgi:hypothetical protein
MVEQQGREGPPTTGLHAEASGQVGEEERHSQSRGGREGVVLVPLVMCASHVTRRGYWW